VTNETTSPAAVTTAPVGIEVKNAHIQYKVYEDRSSSIKSRVLDGFRSRRSTQVHAVKGVSFTVGVGEAVGLIGRNGAGKSTLLRAIGGLQTLTEGSIRIRGEARLLRVGASLKPALSGHRNVLLGGLAIGLTLQEIEDKYEELVDFVDVGEAMYRPLNTFSSGMRARLVFAIATLKAPDILLIDEALAVGDKAFRRRSLAKLNAFRADAGTVVLATHRLGEIRKTCSRVIWIHQGEIVDDGKTADVLARYTELDQ